LTSVPREEKKLRRRVIELIRMHCSNQRDLVGDVFRWLPQLDRLAERVLSADLTADVSTFRLAAETARNHEALRFECESVDEAAQTCAYFVALGCQPPIIEDVRRG
jgi:hypothetical protein